MFNRQGQEIYDKIHAKGKLLFGAQYDSVRTEKQIRQWLEKNPKMTLRGVWSTIRWWYDICGHTTEDANSGFGIVPYVYEDARQYFIDNRQLHDEYYTKETMDKIANPVVVNMTVKPPEFKPKNYFKGYELS